MDQIFLSYNRQDQARAEQFMRAFAAAGLSVWWDVALRAGEVYDEVTENALRGAGAVVVLWSQRAVASRWVRAEATLAQRLGTFVPCMIEPCERPIMFELTQTADLSHWHGDPQDPAWQAFVGHVRDVVFANGKGGTTPAMRPAPAATQPAPPRPGNERRQITFFSGEIADGQRIASSLDPEDWHELLVGLTGELDAVVAPLGGSIKWNGHRFAGTFGYPVAQEDAARRGVQAALGLVARTRELSLAPEDWDGGAVQLRIGVHTGDVLVTVSDQGEAELFGEGSALATHLRDRAARGQVLVSEAVRQLTHRSFELEPVGDDETAGATFAAVSAVSRPVNRSFGEGEGAHFVGREDELQLIASRWRKALGGDSQLVLVRGEPGIGKTRLVEQFRTELDRQAHCWLMLQGSSMFPNTPFHALGQMVQSIADEGLSLPGLDLVVAAASGLAAEVSTGSDQQRARQQGALVQALFGLSEQRPLVLLIDDLQWIDPSTLDVIEMLVEQAEQDRILFLATARPEFSPPWPENERHVRLTLGRLGQDEVRLLVSEMVGDQGLPDAAVSSLIDRADGVPLFAEELARMLARGSGEGAALPSTLRALLAARMDRLGAERELLQLGAVLGRSFSYELLQRVAGLGESELAAMLSRLCDEQLLMVRGHPPMANYRFKHALLQDAAYETLPRKRQRELHRSAAETIVSQLPELAETQQEVVANHWTKAGANAEAVAAWIAAGDAASRRAACKEAAAHYRSALGLIGKLSEGSDRDATELELWSKLNRALQVARGYADPETAEAANRAIELAQKSGAVIRVMTEDVQLWRVAITAGDYNRADVIRDQVMQLAAPLDAAEAPRWLPYFESNARVQTAFYSAGIDQFEHFEDYWQDWLAAVRDPTLKRSPADDTITIGVGAWAAWMQGRTDLAFQRLDDALSLANGSGQAYPVAVSHHFAATLCAFQQDYQATRSHSLKAIEVSEANGFDYILRISRAKLGWAAPAASITDEDISAMRGSLQEMEDNNALVGAILVMNRLALALEGMGRIDDARAVAERALVFNPQEGVARPQTLEILGRLHAVQGDAAAAIASFQAGLDFARQRHLLAPELSLALHLGEMLAEAGDPGGARAALADSLARCTPETNTPALQPVRSLLASLPT